MPGPTARSAQVHSLGRDADISAFETLLARAAAGRASQSLVLTGLRGVGKTVLLNDLATRARGRDWIVAQVEARGDDADTSFRAMASRSLNQSLRQLTGKWGVRDKFRAALATFKSFSVNTDPSGNLALGIEVDARQGRADTRSLEMDLSELAFDLAEPAAELGTGIVVRVDEMQDLDRDELAAISTAVHEAGQRNVPFYVVGRRPFQVCRACWPNLVSTPSGSSPIGRSGHSPRRRPPSP